MTQQKSIRHRGKEYKLVLLRVETHDEQGRPENVTMLYDESNIELSGGEWFITAYCARDCVTPGAMKHCGVDKTPGPGSPKPTL